MKTLLAIWPNTRAFQMFVHHITYHYFWFKHSNKTQTKNSFYNTHNLFADTSRRIINFIPSKPNVWYNKSIIFEVTVMTVHLQLHSLFIAKSEFNFLKSLPNDKWLIFFYQTYHWGDELFSIFSKISKVYSLIVVCSVVMFADLK